MNSFSKSWRRLGLFALAVATACVFPACSPDNKPEDLGVLSQPISSSDTVTSKEVVALSTPSKGVPSITVKETVRFLHKRTFKSNQIYTIQKNGTAEFVDRLSYWMFKDADNVLFRFNEGSNTGIKSSRPSVHIGTRDSVLSSSDSSTVSSVAAGNIEGAARTLVVTRLNTFVDIYNDVTYNLTERVNAEFVPQQSAHFAWVGGSLYKADSQGKVERLSQKPTAHLGVRTSKIAANDAFDSSSVIAGGVSFNGQSRNLIVSREFIHEEPYQRLRYSIQQNETATLVVEQSAHMCIIGGNLYEVKLGSSTVSRLSSKPVARIGERVFKLGSFDRQVSVVVTPLRLSTDHKAILVTVRRNFWHEETFQVKEYYLLSTEIAHYDSSFRLWTVRVDGRLYVVAFAGDVVNDPNVEVIHAPSDLPKPDVIVIDGKDGNPPVVVPGKNRNDDPPVVVPSKPRNDNPPVVVPSKPRNDDPPVVVPSKPRNDAPPVVVPGKKAQSDDPPVLVPNKKRNDSPTLPADTDDAPPVVVPRR